MIEYQIVLTPFGEVLVAERLDKAACLISRKIIFLEFIECGALHPIPELLKKLTQGEDLIDISDKNLYPDRHLFSFNELLDVKKIGWERLAVEGTPFQMKVWRTLFEVPFGDIISYSELACRAGYPAAVRAVATVVASNPISLIIPCHRIVLKGSVVPYHRIIRKGLVAKGGDLNVSTGVLDGDTVSLEDGAGVLDGGVVVLTDSVCTLGEKLHNYGNYRWGWERKSKLIEWERCYIRN